jgi:hypothetical protein
MTLISEAATYNTVEYNTSDRTIASRQQFSFKLHILYFSNGQDMYRLTILFGLACTIPVLVSCFGVHVPDFNFEASLYTYNETRRALEYLLSTRYFIIPYRRREKKQTKYMEQRLVNGA